MADITKCMNKKCKIKKYCYRYTAKDDMWQSYAEFSKDKIIKDKKECKDFWLDRRSKGE